MRTFLFSLFFFFQLAGFAAATEYTFTLVNKTGFEIIDLYFSPASQGEWGDEVLTVDTIPNKESMKIHLSRKEKADTWDIVVNDEHGVAFRWPKIKLAGISKLVLTMKANQPVALFE